MEQLPPLEGSAAPVSAAPGAVSPLPPAPAATTLKNVSLTYAAITHWLTAGFAIPFIGGMVAVFVLLPILEPTDLLSSPLVNLVVLSAIGLGLTWAGVVYSAGFIRKTYAVADPRALAVRATVVLVVVGAAFRALGALRVGAPQDAASLAINLVGFAATIATFYFTSLRYLTRNV